MRKSGSVVFFLLSQMWSVPHVFAKQTEHLIMKKNEGLVEVFRGKSNHKINTGDAIKNQDVIKTSSLGRAEFQTHHCLLVAAPMTEFKIEKKEIVQLKGHLEVSCQNDLKSAKTPSKNSLIEIRFVSKVGKIQITSPIGSLVSHFVSSAEPSNPPMAQKIRIGVIEGILKIAPTKGRSWELDPGEGLTFLDGVSGSTPEKMGVDELLVWKKTVGL